MAINLGILRRRETLMLSLPLSSDILDASKFNNTITAVVGTPSFVGGRLFCNNNTVLSVAPSVSTAIASGNFTIEGKFETTVSGLDQYLISRENLNFRIWIGVNNSLRCRVFTQDSVNFVIDTPDNSINPNQEYKFALQRVGNSLQLWLNDVLFQTAGTNTYSSVIYSSSEPILVAAAGGGYTAKFRGYLRDFKIYRKAIYA